MGGVLEVVVVGGVGRLPLLLRLMGTIPVPRGEVVDDAEKVGLIFWDEVF